MENLQNSGWLPLKTIKYPPIESFSFPLVKPDKEAQTKVIPDELFTGVSGDTVITRLGFTYQPSRNNRLCRLLYVMFCDFKDVGDTSKWKICCSNHYGGQYSEYWNPISQNPRVVSQQFGKIGSDDSEDNLTITKVINFPQTELPYFALVKCGILWKTDYSNTFSHFSFRHVLTGEIKSMDVGQWEIINTIQGITLDVKEKQCVSTSSSTHYMSNIKIWYNWSPGFGIEYISECNELNVASIITLNNTMTQDQHAMAKCCIDVEGGGYGQKTLGEQVCGLNNKTVGTGDCKASLQTYCSKNATQGTCRAFCSQKDINCDVSIQTFCDALPLSERLNQTNVKVCGCYMPQQTYTDYYSEINRIFPEVNIATSKKPVCVYGPCQMADFQPYLYRTGQDTCPNINIQQCLQKLAFDNSGNINTNDFEVKTVNNCIQTNSQSNNNNTNTNVTNNNNNNNSNNENDTNSMLVLYIGGGVVAFILIVGMIWIIASSPSSSSAKNRSKKYERIKQLDYY